MRATRSSQWCEPIPRVYTKMIAQLVTLRAPHRFWRALRTRVPDPLPTDPACHGSVSEFPALGHPSLL